MRKRGASIANHALIALALSGATSAAADELSVVGEVGVASEYMYRGSTQSQGPYVWVTADVVSSSGVYAGAWASNVDFEGDHTYAEYDLYAGYRKRISNLTYDVSVARVDYLGSPESYNFYALRGALRWDWPLGWARTVVSVSPDGPAYYGPIRSIELQAGTNLTTRLTLTGAVGVQEVGDIDNDYAWWHVGFTYRAADNMAIDLRWWDNDSHGYGATYEPRLAIGVAREFSTRN